jgi:hypothetical protein
MQAPCRPLVVDPGTVLAAPTGSGLSRLSWGSVAAASNVGWERYSGVEGWWGCQPVSQGHEWGRAGAAIPVQERGKVCGRMAGLPASDQKM